MTHSAWRTWWFVFFFGCLLLLAYRSQHPTTDPRNPDDRVTDVWTGDGGGWSPSWSKAPPADNEEDVSAEGGEAGDDGD